ncbi:MAG: M48 family metalloprotease [bacterium]
MNALKTAVLLAGLAGMLLAIGWYVGGTQGAVIAFALSMVLNFTSFFWSHKIVLAMYRAKEVAREENPQLHGLVEEIALAAQIPKPRVFVVPTGVPNAFATGRDPAHSVVAVTDGILKIMGRDELKGVLAHEMSHIKHRDILIATVAATVATAITMLASMLRFTAIFGGGGRDGRSRGGLELLALAILAPLAAAVVQMAISRSREYAADEGGARLSGNPLGLANALLKLEGANRASGGMAAPATAHLFIVSSLRGATFASLFSTHPPVEERVRRLRAMAGASA